MLKYLLSLSICGFLNAEVVEPSAYDWTQNIIHAPSKEFAPGHQILHFQSTDHPYQESPEATNFVSQYLQDAKVFTSDADLLRFASDQVTLRGSYLELGVTTGKTANFIAALNPKKTLYGFDSFLADAENYEKNSHRYPKTTFGLKDRSQLPPLLSNVKLIQGPFSEALPYYIGKYSQSQPIAFLHVDCDLYASTSEALQILAPYIQPGTIIVFDEYYHYDGYEQFEFKAFTEFLNQSGYQAEYIGYNAMFQAVAVRIVQ